MLRRDGVLRVARLLVGREAGLKGRVVPDLDHLGDALEVALVVELAEQELLLLLIATRRGLVQIIGDVHRHEGPGSRCKDCLWLKSVDVWLVREE